MKALIYKVKCAVKKISLEDEPQRKTLEKSDEIIHTDYVVKEHVGGAKKADKEYVDNKILPFGLSDVLDDDYEVLEKVPKDKIQKQAKEIIENDFLHKNARRAGQSNDSKEKRPAKSGVGSVRKTSKKNKATNA